MQVIEATERSRPRPEVVWELVADVRTWAEWGAWSDAALEAEGTPAPDGVGAIRRLTAPPRGPVRRPVVSRERVVEFEPPRRLVYELLSGLPLRDYRGTISLSPAGDGTQIEWRSEFEPKIPGTGGLFRRALAGFLADAARRLAAEAERKSLS
jgi:Polyketide cyclase / dehydrase and lipid transport